MRCLVIVPQSLHFPMQPKPFPLHRQKYFEQTTEVTFNPRLANITGLIVRSLFCPMPIHSKSG